MKIVQWLSSVITARNLIMTITAVLIIASLSQSGKLGEQAQQLLGGLYFTKGFAILGLFLLLNTLLCTLAQGKKSWQLQQKISMATTSFKIPLIQKGRPDALFVSKLIRLALPGWRIRKQPEEKKVLRKNYIGLWGSVIFHTGLLFIMLGAFYDALFGFQGSFGLVKGQMFQDKPSYYTDIQKGWFYRDKASQFEVFLHDIKEEYLDQGVKSYGDFSLLRDGTVVQRGTVSANKPLTYRGLTFYKETFGYYVKIAFIRQGKIGNSAYDIALGTHMYPKFETYTRNYIFPQEPYKIYLNFLPNFNGNHQKPGTKSFKAENPFLQVKIYDKGNQKTLHQALIKLGDKVLLPDRTELTFYGYNPYFSFNIRKGYGYLALYTGFVVASVGLTLLYMFTPKQMVLQVEEEVEGKYYLKISGWSYRFPKSFQEEIGETATRIRYIIEEGKINDSP